MLYSNEWCHVCFLLLFWNTKIVVICLSMPLLEQQWKVRCFYVIAICLEVFISLLLSQVHDFVVIKQTNYVFQADSLMLFLIQSKPFCYNFVNKFHNLIFVKATKIAFKYCSYNKGFINVWYRASDIKFWLLSCHILERVPGLNGLERWIQVLVVKSSECGVEGVSSPSD